MKKFISRLSLVCAVALALVAGASLAHASGGYKDKGPQSVTLELLQDEGGLKKAVDELTIDVKGAFFKDVKRVVIPSYFVEFRTTSSGKIARKDPSGSPGVSAAASVTYANADKKALEAVATAALKDLTERLAAAGYEVVNPVDLGLVDEARLIKTMPSGKVTSSTIKQKGFTDYKSMYAAAEGRFIYFDGLAQDPDAMASQHSDGAAVNGNLWAKAGGQGVGILRPRIIVDFVHFGGKPGETASAASTNALPHVKIYGSSLSISSKYARIMGKVYAEGVGSVGLKGGVELASASAGDALGSIAEQDGKWVFTADNEKFAAAALEQIKVFNALMIGKIETLK